MLRLAYNTTNSAILVDQQGYFIGGRGWGAVDTTDHIAKRELAARRIVEADEDAVGSSSNVEAVAAVEALRARRDAVGVAESLSKKELLEQLPPEAVEGLPEGGDGLPAKDDLVDVAVDSGADLEEADEPKKAAAKKKSTSSRRRGQN